MQIVFDGDILHEMSKPVFWEKYEDYEDYLKMFSSHYENTPIQIYWNFYY